MDYMERTQSNFFTILEVDRHGEFPAYVRHATTKTTNFIQMKRTCCFTTLRNMIIIFSNMEFHTTIKKQIIIV